MKMNKQDILKLAESFCMTSPLNYVGDDWGLDKKLVGMQLLDKPIMKVGCADDPWFEKLKNPEIVGPHFKLPKVWLDDAKTVISFFFPTGEQIRNSNRGQNPVPSLEWTVGRVEGQRFIDAFGAYLKTTIISQGYSAVHPYLDDRYVCTHPDPKEDVPPYNSNWSERHVAFVCGLGTFGLHDCIITEKGCAGRLLSLITNIDLELDERDYSERFDYCIKCGQCISKCPFEAIKADGNKDIIECAKLQRFYHRVFIKPRVGCGKCLVGIPCENSRPNKK